MRALADVIRADRFLLNVVQLSTISNSRLRCHVPCYNRLIRELCERSWHSLDKKEVFKCTGKHKINILKKYREKYENC